MVRIRRISLHISWLLPLLMLCIVDVAAAAVSARVDRERVEQNESLSLELTVDSTADISPDLSVLDEDFVIGQTSRLSNTSIDYGQITRSMTWTITLMPKRAGQISIPPISIGNEQSNPVTIIVTKPSYEPPGEADVFITAEVDYDETFVQAQVLYTIKIFRAVATRQPALREPTFSGAEVLVEIAGDERSYEAILNGRAYNVVEREFAIFPQESGEIRISPSRFEARVLRDGRITGRKVFESESRTVVVKPIPAPPADFPNAAWLPATELDLSDDWSREPDELRAGEPISRNVTVSALGQLETQIPIIEPPTATGVNIYPDKPVLKRGLEDGGIRGIRTDQYAMIGVNAGVVMLPQLELPWWDVKAGEWRVARLPERSVNILPSADALPLVPVVAEPEVAAAQPEPIPAVTAQPNLWRRVAEILAVVWLLTLLAWSWSSRPRREDRAPPPVPIHRQQARHLKAARKAALANDARGVRRAMLEWAALQWPEDTPRSIGELAGRVSAPLSDELMRLSEVSYGKNGGLWDATATAKAMRSFAVTDTASQQSSGATLPPLMPGVH
ncbi:MAG: BatD family protein [Gammaproteobacteria bacterium]|nr:BatD family protein [Gammaproteobacteria bacterium]